MAQLLRDTSFIQRPALASGKVREIYDLGEQMLLVVTDRISAFDVVFEDLIPDKGAILNGISAFWFDLTQDIVPNHKISMDPASYPEDLQQWSEALKGRSMLVDKLQMLPAECIVRGYLEGSALKSYRKDGTINGVKMPAGLQQGDRLPELLFTPSTKAESGHDENISVAQFKDLIGTELAEKVMATSLALYERAEAHAHRQGLILADSKFEFGLKDGQLVLGDELFTPDSSRFWDLAKWEPGHAQASFDKQFLRDYLEEIGWSKEPPAPRLPEELIAKIAERYHEAYQRLTGQALAI